MRSVGPGEVPFTTTDSRMEHPCVMFSREMRREKSGVNEVSCLLTTPACTVNHEEMKTMARVERCMIHNLMFSKRGWKLRVLIYISRYPLEIGFSSRLGDCRFATALRHRQSLVWRFYNRWLCMPMRSKTVHDPVGFPTFARASLRFRRVGI
jgi:hypothetical protein